MTLQGDISSVAPPQTSQCLLHILQTVSIHFCGLLQPIHVCGVTEIQCESGYVRERVEQCSNLGPVSFEIHILR